MQALVLAAFTMGFLGSFHCIGMCGPLALSLPMKRNSNLAKWTGVLLYNFGRIVTYIGFGLVFGAIGRTFGFFGYQQVLSISLGVVILLFLLLPGHPSFLKGNKLAYRFLSAWREALGQLFRNQSHSSLFLIGLLNGLLPCGLVYMAAAASIATGTITAGISFMAFFGLGTVPAMWAVAFFGNFVGTNIRSQIRKAYPVIMMGMAFLLIIRGLGLGIPYVSPKISMEKKTVVGCCIRPAEKSK